MLYGLYVKYLKLMYILQHIRVLDFKKLEILPYESNRSKLYHHLQFLAKMLQNILVKVRLKL